MNKRGSWVIGGTTLIGIAIGFVFLAMQFSSLFLVASIILGIGVGLVIASFIAEESTKTPSR